MVTVRVRFSRLIIKRDNTMQTTEQKVGAAVLQKTKQIAVGDRVFSVAPPSTATLILASEAISLLPQQELDKDKIVVESLFVAKDCRVLGDIVAIFILGAKGLTEDITRKVKRRKKGWRGFLGFTETVTVTETIDRKAELAKYLLEELPPKELDIALSNLINDFQLGSFFGLTTFLIGINLLRPTKVVESETTASGQ